MIASAIIVLAWLKKEETRKKMYYYATPPSVSISRCGTPAKVSCNANSLVADENTPDVMLWFIKAYDYNQKRVLNVSFCTRYMGPPFFSRAIPTYGVLPYSMIYAYTSAVHSACGYTASDIHVHFANYSISPVCSPASSKL